MSAQSDLRAHLANAIARQKAAEATRDAAAEAVQAAQAAYEAAHDALRNACFEAHDAAVRLEISELPPERIPTLRGPCPQGRDAVWWTQRGWAIRLTHTSRGATRTWHSVIWEWTEKAKSARRLLESA